MDDLDRHILRTLFSDANRYPSRSEIRESLSSLARRLHVSEPTLRRRVNGYLATGFLRGWQVFINPNVVHEQAAQIHVDVPWGLPKEDVVEQIRLVDGVFLVAKCHGTAIGVGLYFEGLEGLRKRVELIARIARSNHASVGVITFPPCVHQFSRTDLAIIDSIQQAPRRAYSSIAKSVGVSSKTVRRRLDRLIHDRALFVTPSLDYRKLRGAIAADVLVFYADGDSARDAEAKALTLVEPFLVHCIPGCPDHLWASVHLENPAEADEILGRLTRLKGVREAYVNLVEEHMQLPERFRGQVEKLRAMCDAGIRFTRPRPTSRPRHSRA